MRPFSQILCALDFSDESRHALDHAILLAKWYDARLTGLFVYAPPFAPIPDFAVPGLVSSPALPDPSRAVLEQQVVEFLRPCVAAGLAPDHRVGVGDPATEIVRVARTIDADLIATGTHGLGGFEHLLLGSVAEKVLRKAHCPVLTVPPRARATSTLPFRRVLCPVDFGEPSRAALELARSIARESKSDLIVLHVQEPHAGGDDEPLTYRNFSVPEYHQERERAVTRALAELTGGPSPEAPVSLSTRLASGKAYREILGVASEDRIDLIVMGVHGRNPLDVALFGSTTNQVIRRATCPVMTVRA